MLQKDDKVIFETETNSDSNHPYVLKLETSGNLVLYNKERKALWSTKTSFVLPHLVMQENGDLVLYNHVSKIYWSSNKNKSKSI